MALEFRTLAPELEDQLAQLFAALQAAGDATYFHPHPLTRSAAHELCTYHGEDLLYVALDGGGALAYAMLRGWDEGYSIPSLGIALHPAVRGTGLAKTLMSFLHHAAKRKGATSVRLKVYPENVGAVALYRGLGYEFAEQEDGQLVGALALGAD